MIKHRLLSSPITPGIFPKFSFMCIPEVIQLLKVSVARCMGLCHFPHPLDGIQFGWVWRHELQVHSSQECAIRDDACRWYSALSITMALLGIFYAQCTGIWGMSRHCICLWTLWPAFRQLYWQHQTHWSLFCLVPVIWQGMIHRWVPCPDIGAMLLEMVLFNEDNGSFILRETQEFF